MSDSVNTLRTDFGLVAPCLGRLAERFYERLENDHPRLTSRFAGLDSAEQMQMLASGLLVILRYVEQGLDLSRFVSRIREQSVHQQFETRDHAAVCEALLSALAETPDPQRWTGELEDAWLPVVDPVAQYILAMAASSRARARASELRTRQRLGNGNTCEQRPDESRRSVKQNHIDNINFTRQPHPFPATSSAFAKETIMSNGTLTGSWLNAQESTSSDNQELPFRLLELAPQAMFFVQPDGVVSFLNQRGRELLQLLEGALGITPEHFVGENIRKLYRQFNGLEAACNRPQGSKPARLTLENMVLEVQTLPISDAKGSKLGTLHTWELATDRARMEASHWENAAKLSAIGNVQAVIEFKMDGTILTANENFLKTVGYRLDEIQGKHHRMFVTETYANSPEYREFWARLNRNESIADEFLRVGNGGKQVWIRASYNVIPDETGKPVKVVKYADDITADVRARADMVRIQNMMENLPINVILANRDFEIVYMNPASTKTLKSLEHLLPVPVEQIMGQKIDIFHKQPEHQRRLVGDPRNLPHRAKIKVGPETLDLLVSAIIDKEKHFIGPMVTWSIVSQQVKAAEGIGEIKAIAQVVTSSATEMQTNSRNLAANAEETARQAQVVSAASEQATRNVETVSSAAEELSASISEIARHVQDASKMTAQAVTQANQTNATIKQLGEASTEIGQVVKVITSIAQQTNLLALNATIEAARAGEAGKGFAVVANEVKELARQTAKATEEISQKITAIQASTSQAVMAIGSIGDSISKINEISTTIARAVQEQTAATGEISRNVAEAARGTAEVTNNISGVSQAAGDSGKSASDMLAASGGLAQEAERLDKLVTDFAEFLQKL